MPNRPTPEREGISTAPSDHYSLAPEDIAQLVKEHRQLMHEVNYLETELDRLKEEYDRLCFMAEHDGLTGVYTRQVAVSLIEKAMDASHGPFILAFADIDDFKYFNDTYGHLAGDEILVALGHFLEVKAKGHGVVGRFGGDEFLIFLDLEEEQRLNPELHLPGPDQPLKNDGMLFQFADSIRVEAMDAINLYPGKNGRPPSISLGVALARRMLSADDLILIADEALYESKERGRNTITLVDA